MKTFLMLLQINPIDKSDKYQIENITFSNFKEK